jgi:two-component system sensor histidine kinase DevS
VPSEVAAPEPSLTRTIGDELFWGVVDAAPDAIVMIDRSGSIVLANRQAELLFGYPRSEIVGQPLEVLVPERFRHRHLEHRAQYEHAPRTRPMGTGLPLVGRRKDGSEFRVEISLSPFDRAPGDGAMTIAIVRDIAERLESERLLRDAEANLQLLQDRERIARDLHDLVIQRLFAAGMALQGTVGRVEDADVTSRIGRVVDDLDDTIRQLRSVIFGLSDRSAGSPSLRREVLGTVADLRPALGFDPDVTFDGPVDTVGDVLAEQLLPTVREALTNVARHAQASATTLTLLAAPGELILEVVDNGVGCDPAARGGHGLANARARAATLGGTCSVSRGPDGGTAFRWQVPLTG